MNNSGFTKNVNFTKAKLLVPIFYSNSCCGLYYDKLLQEMSTIIPVALENQHLISPTEANLLMIIGPVSNKMLSNILQTYEKMDSPKWVITVGDCTMVQGIFETSDSIVRPSNYLEVEDHVPGCPPSIRDIVATVQKLKNKISGNI